MTKATKTTTKPKTFMLTVGELWDIRFAVEEATGKRPPDDEEVQVVTDARGWLKSVVFQGKDYIDYIHYPTRRWLRDLIGPDPFPSDVDARARRKFAVAAELTGELHELTQCHSLPCVPADEGMESWFSCNSGGREIHVPMQNAFLAVADGKDWVEAGRPFFDGVIEMLNDWALDTYYPNGCPVCSCGDKESDDLDPDEAAAVALDQLAERLRERAAKRKQLAATREPGEGKR